MLQFVRPTQCFWYFVFIFVLFCLCRYEGLGQWVIKYYINIYERMRFVVQNLNWACRGKKQRWPKPTWTESSTFFFFFHIQYSTEHILKHTYIVFFWWLTSHLWMTEGKPQMVDATFTFLLASHKLVPLVDMVTQMSGVFNHNTPLMRKRKTCGVVQEAGESLEWVQLNIW